MKRNSCFAHHQTALAPLLLVACTACLIAAGGAGAYRYSKRLELPKLTQEELVAIPFDSDVYGAAAVGFPDVRIFDGKGAEVPYLLDKTTGTRKVESQTRWPAKIESLKETEGGGVEIEISRTEKEAAPDGLTIETPLTDYRHRVQVFGRQGDEWLPLVKDGLVFDYTRYIDVSNQDVALPKNDHRLFRIVIDDVTAEQESQLMKLTRSVRGKDSGDATETVMIERRPFRIDRITFWDDTVVEEKTGNRLIRYPVEHSVEQDAKEHLTRITVKTRREPLTALVLETSSRNFSRPASVKVIEKRGGMTEWNEIGSSTIDRLDFRDLQREHLRIEFPEARRDEYRIMIQNGDSPSLDVTEVYGEGIEYRALMFASPDGSYQLAYGAEKPEAARYDTAALDASRGKGYEPQLATLGPQVEDPVGGKAPPDAAADLLNNPVILGVTIGALVVVLGLGLYRASRRIDALPKDEG